MRAPRWWPRRCWPPASTCSPAGPTCTWCSPTCATPSSTASRPRIGSNEIGITVNRNAVPFDPRPPAVSSGLRIGTPALATRGLGVDDFREVGRMIGEALTGDFSDEQAGGPDPAHEGARRALPAVPAAGAGGRLAQAPASRFRRAGGYPDRDGRARCPLGVPRRGRDRLRGDASNRPLRPPTRGAPLSPRARPARPARPRPRRPRDPGRRGRVRADLPARTPRRRAESSAARWRSRSSGALDDARPGGLDPLGQARWASSPPRRSSSGPTCAWRT